MDGCFLVEETVPVFLTLWDRPGHSMTFAVGFVELISYGSLVSLPWDQAVPKLGWGGPGKVMLEAARLFHSSFEQGFEKEGAFLGH